MKIGEAAKLSGLTVKTVRYYADINIIVPQRNSITGYRDFSKEDIAKLQFVGRARKFNFSIQECRELLSLYEDKARPSKNVKKIAIEKISEIKAKLKELESLKNQLSGLANACQGNNRPNCPILDALSD
jgi:Cu(I)-responsive transcriptional regulator|tara:strand:+ start:332 stop:718 length:387 start_codon:yes stop_codon:yes gene_type:complete